MNSVFALLKETFVKRIHVTSASPRLSLIAQNLHLIANVIIILEITQALKVAAFFFFLQVHVQLYML